LQFNLFDTLVQTLDRDMCQVSVISKGLQVLADGIGVWNSEIGERNCGYQPLNIAVKMILLKFHWHLKMYTWLNVKMMLQEHPHNQMKIMNRAVFAIAKNEGHDRICIRPSET